MKKIIFSFILAIAMINTLCASGIDTEIGQGLEKLRAASTPDAVAEATNYFERLSEAHPGEWLPLYYAAYGSLKAGLQEENESQKDMWYKKGIAFIEKAGAIKKDDSEILSMEAYLRLMYIANDSMKRAPAQTAAALALLDRAKELDPANPRPWFIHGQNTLFTPPFFGGGAKNARPLLEKAVELYEKFQPSDPVMPDWGKERCTKLLEKCKES
jgi:tetratricopeptide (TPR) repeat protein